MNKRKRSGSHATTNGCGQSSRRLSLLGKPGGTHASPVADVTVCVAGEPRTFSSRAILPVCTSRLLCTRLLSAAELLPATTAAATVVLFSAALPGALLLRCAALQQFGELRHAGSTQTVLSVTIVSLATATIWASRPLISCLTRYGDERPSPSDVELRPPHVFALRA